MVQRLVALFGRLKELAKEQKRANDLKEREMDILEKNNEIAEKLISKK